MSTKHGIKDLAQGRSDVFRIDPRILQVRPGWNARETDFDPKDEDDLALANSIAESGVKEALTVIQDGGKLVVTNGHRRRAATMYAIEKLNADIKTVPVQTEPRYSSEAEHVLSQIVRNAGKPLSPFEKGKVFKRLLDFGWSPSEIAKKTGFTSSRVSQCLELHAAPEAVKSMVRDGKVSASFAMQTLKAADGDSEKAAETLQSAVKTATAAGKSRATPKHVDGGTPRAHLKTVLKDAFDASEIDEGETVVLISMPEGQFAMVRELLGL